MLDSVEMVHMNGRVYYPKIGRFLSPDPYVQAPYDSQSLNRYSYVLNNPLSYTDPSGFNWDYEGDWLYSPFDLLAGISFGGGVRSGPICHGFCVGFNFHQRARDRARDVVRPVDDDNDDGPIEPEPKAVQDVAPIGPAAGIGAGGGADSTVGGTSFNDAISLLGSGYYERTGTSVLADGTILLSQSPERFYAATDPIAAAKYARAQDYLAVMWLAGTTLLGPEATLGGTIRGAAARGLAEDAALTVGRDPTRIYSARELIRRAQESGPFHNFPESFNASIFRGNRTAISDSYVLYTQRGSINGVSGTFEIGVRPSASGRTEVILHRFFRPDGS